MWCQDTIHTEPPTPALPIENYSPTQDIYSPPLKDREIWGKEKFWNPQNTFKTGGSRTRATVWSSLGYIVYFKPICVRVKLSLKTITYLWKSVQIPLKARHGGMSVIPGLKCGDRGILGNCSLVSLTKPVSLGFSERPILKKKKVVSHRGNYLALPSASMSPAINKQTHEQTKTEVWPLPWCCPITYYLRELCSGLPELRDLLRQYFDTVQNCHNKGQLLKKNSHCSQALWLGKVRGERAVLIVHPSGDEGSQRSLPESRTQWLLWRW